MPTTAHNLQTHARDAMRAAARAVLLLCSLGLASARVLLEVLAPHQPHTSLYSARSRAFDVAARRSLRSCDHRCVRRVARAR